MADASCMRSFAWSILFGAVTGSQTAERVDAA